MSRLSESGKEIAPTAIMVVEQKQRIDLTTILAKAFVERYGEEVSDGFSQITIGELNNLGHRILNCQSIWDVYGVLADVNHKNISYYDLVIGPQHVRGLFAISLVFKKFESEKVQKGLDVGAGTGESTITLASICKHVTAIDRMPQMLAHARKKLDTLERKRIIQGYDIKIMDADNLQFPEKAFDVVFDHGLMAYLTYDELHQYWVSVHRILKPGGRYYQYHADSSQIDVYQTSPRAVLAGLVAQSVFSFSFIALHQKEQYRPFDPRSIGYEGGAIEIKGKPYFEQVIRFSKI